ncbi:MAG: sulfur carrier protein ThiS, partial [Thermomicrobiales bacterium]|nr:sulfur carrier protein ThiS [Thermomicrobiales bacterium]
TGATYLVAGHLFETGSKDGLPPIGIDRFAEIVRVAPAPVLAIGGVTPDRLAPLLAVGAAGVAVMSPFTQKATIAERVADYRKVLESPMPESSTATITATINGKPTELPAGTTISTFLAGRELHERLVVVERNGEIVNRSAFSEVVVEEGDLLEIVHFVGGGA